MSRYILAAFALVLLAALFFTVIKPSFVRLQAAESDLTEYKLTIERANLLRTRIDELTALRNRIIPGDLVRLEAVLPDTIDSVKLALLLDTVAAKHDMTVSAIKIEPELPPTPEVMYDPTTGLPIENLMPVDRTSRFLRTAVSFSLEGSYEQLREFIADLESNLVLMDISQLSISGAESEDADLGSYDVTVHVYEYHPPTQ